MQYNLARNGSLEALTASGTGNKSLSWSQLESLMDGTTTSGGVTLAPGDVLYLESDLSNRIKIDDIRLYASDLTKISAIDFYYKNSAEESYTACSKNVSTYYYATIPSPSAPQYICVTVSGIDIELYEFQIFNDDYIVAFGEDGEQYAKYLGDTPIGEESDTMSVAIYNNSSEAMSADAYVCVDYTGNDADRYVKISSSENGTYYGINDGAIIEDNKEDSIYTWDMGSLDDLKIVSNSLVVDMDIPETEGKLGDLPLLDASASWNVGYRPWDYDFVNNIVYAIGTDVGETSLWLYKYEVDNSVWSYIGEVNPGLSAGFEDESVMCYVDGYVYVCCSYDLEFGRYTLSGVQDNWEALTPPPFIANPTRLGIVYDQSEYIYMTHGNTSADNEFYRYSTISGEAAGWESLDSSYNKNHYRHSGHFRMTLTYDVDRDYIYMDNGKNGIGNYIQRYFVSTDTWDITYIDKNDGLGGCPAYMTIYYYKNYIIFFGNGYTPTFYFYHIPTQNIYEKDVGDPVVHNNGIPYMLPIEPVEDDFCFSILFSNVDGDKGGLYGYNISYVPVVTSGTYITPIFSLDNKYKASYFIMDGTTTSGLNNISYDDQIYNGTIRVRSSDTSPLTVDEIYWIYRDSSTINFINKIVVYNGYSEIEWVEAQTSSRYHPSGVAVNRRNGNIAVNLLYSYFGTYGALAIYEHDGSSLYTSSYQSNLYFDVNFEFDKFGGIWGYGSIRKCLTHYEYDLTDFIYSDVGTVDFIYDLAVEMDGDGVWYTDKVYDLLVHKDFEGTILISKSLPEPRSICGTSDSGCWVIDNQDEKAYRYDFDGNLVKTVNIGRTATRMCTDMNDGFWYISGNYVYHVFSNGIEGSNANVLDASRIKGGHNGCVVWIENYNQIKYIDNDGNITRTFNDPVGTGQNGYPALLSVKHSDFLEFNYTNGMMPVEYDPVWGSNGSLEWKEVKKDGYFLPKVQYHQVEVALRTYMNSPSLNKIILAPAVKIQDIQPQTSKDIYIKTNIPDGADITDYETKLKAWWGINE
jgi:hypothetical protein